MKHRIKTNILDYNNVTVKIGDILKRWTPDEDNALEETPKIITVTSIDNDGIFGTSNDGTKCFLCAHYINGMYIHMVKTIK